MTTEILLKVAKKKIPVILIPKPRERIELEFPYFPPLIDEVKAMEGAKYHGYDEVDPRKVWSIKDSQRNAFTLKFLMGENPYERWDRSRQQLTYSRPLMQHQKEMTEHILTVRWGIWAVEMRCGKTLAAIEAMERSGFSDEEILWVGPRSALAGARLEFRQWKSRVNPRIVTYEGLKEVVGRWPNGHPAPKMIVFDEASRVKTPTSQRSQAAKHIADSIRADHGENGIILLMSGTPAPKTPIDWWHLCEIACPGFLKESTPERLRRTLAKIEQKEGIAGGSYPQLVTWFDDENKCAKCGGFVNDREHGATAVVNPHSFVKSKNEVRRLYNRMKGLVEVRFKKDILDLPEKIFRIVHCKPSRDVLNAWEIIKAKSARTITALILSRELSDGFQYKEIECGETNCLLCNGVGKVNPDLLPKVDEVINEGNVEDYMHLDIDNLLYSGDDMVYDSDNPKCPNCKGSGKQKKYRRETFEVDSPKIDICRDLLDEHEDVGRIVFYAGFTGSVERLEKLCRKEQWTTIRVDGSGWSCSNPDLRTPEDMLFAFGNKENNEKLAFISQPKSGGMGIDLSASPTVVFYSNDFDGEARFQAVERAHGPKMNRNLGCTIIDLINLPTDQYVLDNLEKKRKLQAISMGEFQSTIKDYKIGNREV